MTDDQAVPQSPDAEHEEAGYEPFIAAESWREDTSIRYVPESAVAEAVAAERERIRRSLRGRTSQGLIKDYMYVADVRALLDGGTDGK